MDLLRASQKVLLSAEERYQVWLVKSAERPHLLEKYDERDKEDVSEDSREPPISDGCDISGWRRSCVVQPRHCSQIRLNGPCILEALTVACNVGAGCTMLRRETQLPLTIPRNFFLRWELLRQRLLVQSQLYSTRRAARLLYQDLLEMDNEARVNPPLKHHGRRSYIPWFEKENVPVVILGCADDWTAIQSCTYANLLRRFDPPEEDLSDGIADDGCQEVLWRFSDTHGETMSLRTYDKYLRSVEGGLTDDSPLAIYDSQFGMEPLDPRSIILSEYNVPKCFDADLFELLDMNDDVHSGSLITERQGCEEKKQAANDVSEEESDFPNEHIFEESSLSDAARPPYRWILVGPARSGTGLHIDPVGTHAWVTLIEGCKRWVLFPSGTPADSIYMQTPQIPSVLWFCDYYDEVMNRNPDAVEVIQYPGETVYVPAGWPHLVLNLDLSVAITHNYATEYPSMSRLYRAVFESEPLVARRFYRSLQQDRPDLVEFVANHKPPMN
jgi:Cupin-like domain